MIYRFSETFRNFTSFLTDTMNPLSEIGKTVRHYPRAIGLIWRASPKETVVFSFFNLLSAAITPLQIWLSKYIVDEVIAAVQATEGTSTTHLRMIAILVGLQLLIWVASNAITSITNMLLYPLNLRVTYYTEKLIFQKLSRLDLAFFESPVFFDQMMHARTQSVQRIPNFVGNFAGLLSSILMLISLLIMVANLHILAMLGIVFLSVPHLVVTSYFGKRWFRLLFRQTAERRLADYLSNLLSTRESVKEIKLFGLHKVLINRFHVLSQKFVRENHTLSLTQEISQVVLNLLSTVSTAGVWLYAALRAIGQHITIGDMMLYFQASERARSTIVNVFRSSGTFYENSLFLEHLFGFLDLDPNAVEGTLQQPENQTELKKVDHPIRKGIIFEDVSFTYPGTEESVLKNVSFTIAPGECIAIVGRNGVGKTTLVKLLTRLYDPSSGNIRLDGIDLKAYHLENLYSQFSVVFQDFLQYHFSVQENIGFGQVDAGNDMERIRTAAEKAGSLARIEKLPKGFDTVLGRTLEEGVDLSGGEWQKIALARAFMRDAQILVLDEPTAALDAVAEEEIFQRFNELTTGKTSVIISHRFSTVKMADRILVLEDGRLVEQGTHDELMKRNGIYAEMYTLQAQRYS
ncbi:ABC transporter ATP-binding protein [Candidatus Poribacteria bacterium]|nr:ABC transporter ATP-binding protein [Candidatus Poribacteria bacterium]